MKKILFLFILFFSAANLPAQQVKLGVSSGFMFYDLKNQKNEPKNVINGYGVQNDIFIGYSLRAKRVQFPIALGYSRFEHLDNNFYYIWDKHPSRSRLTSSYISLKTGAEIPLIGEKFHFLSGFTTYLLAHKHRINSTERRLFVNADLGFALSFKKSQLFLTTPLTLLPLYKESGISYLHENGLWYDIDSFVEMNGFNLGFKYTLF